MLVVCPLVALMKEHVVHFSSMGISAAYVSDKDDPTVRQSIKNGEVQLVFLSHESLFLTSEWRRMLCTELYQANLVGFIIDEAHCVKKWCVFVFVFLSCYK